MQGHARALAAEHTVGQERASDRLLARLSDNERALARACALLTDAVARKTRISPAGEWLLDNFFLVEEQIRTARTHLPKAYSRRLPRLAEGPLAGRPRVYAIALDTISHGDGRVDANGLSSFVGAYQSVTPLQLGELWAIPIMLRLSLIENLRRVATRIADGLIERNRAAQWADQMTTVAENDPKSLILSTADMARSGLPMASSFVAEFARRLQGQSPALTLPLTWIEQVLAESGSTIAQSIQSENQQQAADQISISNSIGSLRFLSAMDWREFVETMSVVEHRLREDPAHVYSSMDFATRDRYRHVIEQLARASGRGEREVAHKAIELAQAGAARNGRDDREAHVGYYLIDQGLPGLEQALPLHHTLRDVAARQWRRHPLSCYLGSIALLTAGLGCAFIAQGHAYGLRGTMLVVVGAVSLLCASHIGIALVNWMVTLLAAPRSLARMDCTGPIAPEARTLVAIPTLLTSAAAISEVVEALEIRFLANRDDNLHFALLTDFRDALDASAPDDEALLQLVREGIDRLNARYPRSPGTSFFLFHRPRRWNARERLWMGYERKRGKLSELNAFLRGGPRDRFSLVLGDTSVLGNVKYVITLDSDTQLPRDSARKFIATMSHPLNRPRYDERAGRVTQGYGVLQPRVATSPGTNRTRYARMATAESGIDPYTRAISDVYQDLFGEGSFIGKGIYEVDAFEHALARRLPENRILSHDLLEGCYIRSGLLSDVQLFERAPGRYSADVVRRHRWIRGDWQIARWLFPRLPGPGSEALANPLSPLSRWKIFDNLRRSLIPVALMLFLLLGWTWLAPAWLWTAAMLGIVAIPTLAAAVVGATRKPDDIRHATHFAAASRAAAGQLSEVMFALACLPYEAYVSIHAIATTAWRMLVTRRGLLDWTTSSESERVADASLRASWRAMWFAPSLAAASAIHLAVFAPASLAAATPILLLWFLSPAIAWWLSAPVPVRAARLSAQQTDFLRRSARRTWDFFETFVTAQDHWLPPDNYQEHPASAVAHRTSPTNMGLALLANLAARDFGYISSARLIERTARAIDTMAALERHRGHFYNWYDTETLRPLSPHYVSTVDGGNLAGHLMTLQAGLLQLPDERILSPRLLPGLIDTFRILALAMPGDETARLQPLQDELDTADNAAADALASTRPQLEHLAQSACALASEMDVDADSEAQRWALALCRQCRDVCDDLAHLAPWTQLAPAPAGLDAGLALPVNPTLRELARLDSDVLPHVRQRLASTAGADERRWLADLCALLELGSERARARVVELERLAREASRLADMDYRFLFDPARKLLSIGYNAVEHRRDASFYDLLASEARLSVFVGIARGALPQDSWFALGRQLVNLDGETALVSWSGSMFEYLMPLLVMPSYEHTLLDQTCRAAVAQQIAYGAKRGVPWGISESGYNAVDVHLTYQYRAFGVPGLGMKRGLAEDLVVAPYASALALMVAPEQACANLQRLADEGLEGPYGFYEAVDYTPSRLPRGLSSIVVRSFMAHHSGMSLLALAHVLLGAPMQKRFGSDPLFRATALLLQERIPTAAGSLSIAMELSDAQVDHSQPESPVRVLVNPNSALPEVQLLSNGRYHVMVTHAGGSYSRWNDIAVTRWREDGTCDNWGTFFYLRDVASGALWSAAHQPVRASAERYEAIFSEGRAEFRRHDQDIETYSEIAVSPEDDIELRRITLINRSRTRRTIELTSYSEVVLALASADALHPMFSNLFVQTEIVSERQAILCTRRPRSEDEPALWMFHLLATHGTQVADISYETDRARFIGRGQTTADPQAARSDTALSGAEGSVLDPIVAIRCRVTLEPEQEATLDFVLGVGDSRAACLTLAEKYHDRPMADRVFDMAWTHAQVVLRQINATEADAQLYSRLAAAVLYHNPVLRADSALVLRNNRGQSDLWGYSISGDLPIVLLQISDPANIDLVRQLVRAHAYWRLKGLTADLVIWNEDHTGYRQVLNDQIMGLMASGLEANLMDRPGGVFVRQGEQIAPDDRVLLQTVARAIVTDARGTLAAQIGRRGPVELAVPRLKPVRAQPDQAAAVAHSPRTDLIFHNGLGGFTPDGREYVSTTTREQRTPAPWCNVLANAFFGSVISESGSAYTWSENAHEMRLTPWHNDPTTDASGEAFYLRDEESGHFWSPTPLPAPGAGPYTARHGFGYSVFEHTEAGIRSEVWTYVDREAAVKFLVVKLRNESDRPRRLSGAAYVEWVLGDLRPKTAMHVVTEIDADTGALFARNPYSTEFPDRVGFLDVDDATRGFTGDRTEFIGRNGTLQSPAAMGRTRLSGKVGATLDPCGALQVAIGLSPGSERELVVMIGAGKNANDARELVRRFRGSKAARAALDRVWQYWNETLGALHVETPDPSINVMANGWLLYQTLACRLWARSGYYQSGGAYGFRDQLQDTMALVHAEPGLVREHLLLCASRQFKEGDVQHWWHPPMGRGVRTRCSDDYLWLPLVACRYVLATGDRGVLDESIPLLEGRAVNPDADSYYDLPQSAGESDSLYGHCARAIVHGLRFGEHGLPLMGSGDWNDGMNMVGLHGRGESVWLAFFLHEVLIRFADVARMRGDDAMVERCAAEAARLGRNIEANAWDGQWYRRAYFDDGTPLGAAGDSECQIDSIAQSWSVLSAAGSPRRAQMAMDSLDRRLVRRDHGLIQLLDPPFDKSALNPGYIKGYVPGVRENGGQYTHAAIWAAMAFAALGDARRAWELTGMINPVSHAGSADGLATYKVEPYVMAADVYAVAPHTGRGGWTWYTGSAGWMYRLIVESLLGVTREGESLRLAPCLPAQWSSYKLHYRYRRSVYHIDVTQGDAESIPALKIDGVERQDQVIPLLDDAREHWVELAVGRRAVSPAAPELVQ
ncbi:MAG: cyclic beta 1-2 glucan synthetase [Betaproteobacteria bacterium]|nr:cyclic beta 1-2 glucan synthetase [Betaproteobacteria bacterium]